jgi:hypothetical protein
MKFPVAISAAFGALICFAESAFSAQIWTQTSAPTTNWVSVACSADGTKIVAAAGTALVTQTGSRAGPIYTSTDSGATWAPTGAPLTTWTAVACSADGTRLVAAGLGQWPIDLGGSIYTSTDSGATWIQTSAPISVWNSMACSADGTQIIGTDFSVIYASENAGAAWAPTFTNNGGNPFVGFTSVASSANGRVLIGGARTTLYNYSNNCYTSTDSGANWTPTTFVPNPVSWISVASSADGVALLAAFGPWLYRSPDSGTTWTQMNVAVGNASILSVASSADGTRLVAGTFLPGGIYTSADSGYFWFSNDVPITGSGPAFVASSADGATLVAAVNDGGIWVSRTSAIPLLSITAPGSNVIVSWTVPSMNFTLQQNAALNTTNWTDVPIAPTLNLTNLHQEVLVDPTLGRNFYRLKH